MGDPGRTDDGWVVAVRAGEESFDLPVDQGMTEGSIYPAEGGLGTEAGRFQIQRLEDLLGVIPSSHTYR